PSGGPGRYAGNFVLTEFEVLYQGPGDAKPRRAELQRASASWEQRTTDQPDAWPLHTAARAIDGDASNASGRAINPKEGQSHYLIVHAAHPIGDAQQTTLTFVIHQNYGYQRTLGRLRLSATTHPNPATLS